MSVWYSVDGAVKVRKCKLAEDIVDEINDFFNDTVRAEYVENDDNTARVEIEGGVECSYGTVQDFATVVQKLNPYVLVGTWIKGEMDDTEESIYVGPPGGEDAATSRQAVDEIMELSQKLLPADKDLLKGMLYGGD